MKYLESDFCCAMNTESAALMGCDMARTKRAFRCYGSVLEIDNMSNLPTKYHSLCIEFDALAQENKDKFNPPEEVI